MDLTAGMLKKNNSIKSQKCRLAKSLLRKECMKMTKFITENNNNEESRNRKSKGEYNNKIKEVTKSRRLHAMKMKIHGTISSPKQNRPKNLLPKNPQVPLSQITIKLLKTQAQLVIKKIEIMKNRGIRMPKRKMIKKMIKNKVASKKEDHF